jgi:hypothetical protein
MGYIHWLLLFVIIIIIVNWARAIVDIAKLCVQSATICNTTIQSEHTSIAAFTLVR